MVFDRLRLTYFVRLTMTLDFVVTLSLIPIFRDVNGLRQTQTDIEYFCQHEYGFVYGFVRLTMTLKAIY
jgi:uncharacterized membrane protein